MFVRLENIQDLNITNNNGIQSISFICNVYDGLTSGKKVKITIPKSILEGKLIDSETVTKIDKKSKDERDIYFHTKKSKLRLDFNCLCSNDAEIYYNVEEIND